MAVKRERGREVVGCEIVDVEGEKEGKRAKVEHVLTIKADEDTKV